MTLPILESCDDCGACCCHMIVPPFIINATYDETLERKVPQHLLEELLPIWEVRLQLNETPCIWYDPKSKQCKHYEIRPRACRDFEINSPSCRACREKHSI